eukprot:6982398-Ditylum_brightwellii.AAC.1
MPPNWTLVASLYQKAYTKHCYRCTLKDPTKQIVQVSHGNMFVDDKHLLHSGKLTYGTDTS